MKVVYDIEIYNNFFLIVFYELESKTFKIFAISPYMDDRAELWEYLKGVEAMVGFNNMGFDYPILHLFIILLNQNFDIPAEELVWRLKKKANEIINNRGNKFTHVIYSPTIKQIDLFKIHHYDNIAKTTSLKALEFVLRMREIEELPYHPDSVLDYNQMTKVMFYCVKDVKTTIKFYFKSLEEIELREQLSEKYQMDMTNFNDTKIGENILLQAVKKATGRDVLGKTIRKKIVVKDILFDYLAFYTPEFKAIYNWFSDKVITQTKGTFSNLDLKEVESLRPYVNTEKAMLKKGRLTTLNIVHNGFQYDFGVGGIHGSISPGIYVDDDDFAILDVDVKSYYPRLAIENRYYPEHLDEIFCDIYLDIYKERQLHPKKSPWNKALKLALNGAYGKSNSQYSELCDAQYTMTTTINGQLSLCMLAEMLSFVPNLTMLQINTDGLTIKVPKDFLMVVKNICNKWEEITKLDLEYVRYNKMVIRDVNNYLAVYRDSNGNDSGVKRKGTFEYEREYHQNHSMMIVPRAIEKYFLNGIPVEESIREHDDLWDFFKRVKLVGDSRLVARTIEDVPMQKLTRYYVSREGSSLIKIMPPIKGKVKDREFNVEANHLCTTANVVTDELLDEMKNNLDYSYYVDECNKIIETVENGS